MTTGGEAMGGDELEPRVSALEKSVTRMEAKLDRLLDRQEDTNVRLAKIEEKLEQKASASELAKIGEKLEQKASAGELAKIGEKLEQKASAGELAKIGEKIEHRAAATELAEVKGRVNSLPTTFEMITLVFGILAGAFLILRFGLPHAP